MIGSNLVRRLVTEGHRVTVVDNLWRGRLENLTDEDGAPMIDFDQDFHKLDLSVPGRLDALLPGVDYVVHLADVVAGVDYVFSHAWQVFQANLAINSNVLKSVAGNDLKGYLYVGTACSFPHTLQTGPDSRPLVEADLYPAWPESSYGWSKLLGFYESELMHSATGIPVANLILHNVYGAPCDYSTQRAQVIPSLIRKTIESNGEPLVVWGSGDQGRSFIYVDDVTEALMLALRKGWNEGVVQVGTEVCVSIADIAAKVIGISGKNLDIEFDPSMPEGDLGRRADCSKAFDLLGWTPRVDLDDGLKRTYDWIRNQLECVPQPLSHRNLPV